MRVRCRSRSRKPTWEMDARELARVVAEHRGYMTEGSGHIYTADGEHVCHGYGQLAERLERRGVIVPGKGVNWQRHAA